MRTTGFTGRSNNDDENNSSSSNNSNENNIVSGKDGSKMTEDEISRIIESQRQKLHQQQQTDRKITENTQPNFVGKDIDRDGGKIGSTNGKGIESSFEVLDAPEGVWHHNPAYDAPDTSQVNVDDKTSQIDDALKTSPNHDVNESTLSAFKTVRELNERIQSMSQDLDLARQKANKINEDLRREMGNESDYENYRSEKLATRCPEKANQPDEKYFRKIKVTLSDVKTESPKTFSRQNSAPESCRKIPISKSDEPFSRPGGIFDAEEDVSAKKVKRVNVRIRSQSAKPVVEPTETNRVIITELSSSDDDDDDEDNNNNSSSSKEEESPVYKATVRMSQRPTLRKADDDSANRKNVDNDISFRRQKVPLGNVGRPESIYIDPGVVNFDVDFGERLRYKNKIDCATIPPNCAYSSIFCITYLIAVKEFGSVLI